MITNGQRLDTLKPQLDEIQKCLSKVTAMLISNPDTVITFETMSDEDRQEFDRQDAEIERIVAMPATEVEVTIVAEPHDDRIIAQQLADAISGTYIATSDSHGITVDVSDHLDARLALIDPYNEGYPYERDPHEETEETHD